MRGCGWVTLLSLCRGWIVLSHRQVLLGHATGAVQGDAAAHSGNCAEATPGGIAGWGW